MSNYTQYPISDPILFFPIRLETKFESRSKLEQRRYPMADTKLRIRMYPDTINTFKDVNYFTASEIEQGKEYWCTTYCLSQITSKEGKDFRNVFLKNRFGELSRALGDSRSQFLLSELKRSDSFNSADQSVFWHDQRNSVSEMYGSVEMLKKWMTDVDQYPLGERFATSSSLSPYSSIQKVSLLSEMYAQLKQTCEEVRGELVGELKQKVQRHLRYSNKITHQLNGSDILKPYGDFIELEDARNEILQFLYPDERDALEQKKRFDREPRTFLRKQITLPVMATFTERERFSFIHLGKKYLTYSSLFNELTALIKSLDRVLNDTPVIIPVNEYPYLFNKIPVKKEQWFQKKIYEAMPDYYIAYYIDAAGVGHELGRSNKVTISEVDLNDILPSEKQVQDGSREISNTWHTDYAIALQMGMAITVSLSPKKWQSMGKSIDTLVVIGTQRESISKTNNESLQNLFNGHRASSDALGFVAPGTPTNNTATHNTSISENDSNSDHIYDTIIDPLLHAPDFQEVLPEASSDQGRLENALGLNAGTCNTFFNAKNKTIQNAQYMNGLMSNATIGSLLFDFWGTVADQAMIPFAKEFYEKYVIARGYLPTIRIDRQPYGIMPTTSWSTFKTIKTDLEKQETREDSLRVTKFNEKSFKLINTLYEQYTALARTKVVFKSEMERSASPHKKYVDMIGNTPISQEFRYRGAVNAGNRVDTEPFAHFLKELVNFQEDETLNADSLASRFSETFEISDLKHTFPKGSQVSQKALQDRLEYLLYKSRALNLRYLDTPQNYTGHIISHDEASNALQFSDGNNYIQWLADYCSDPEYIMNVETTPIDGPSSDRIGNRGSKISEEVQQELKLPNKLDTESGTPNAGSLLFFMLRHSYLLMVKREAIGIMKAFGWEYEKRVNNYKNTIIYKDYSDDWGVLFEGIGNYVRNTHVKNTDLFKQLKGRSMASILSGTNDYRTKAISDSHKAIAKYREYLMALSQCSMGDLKNLLFEQTDLAAHRIDAWKLGFVNQRLDMMSRTKDYRVQVAQFGYLEDLSPANRTPEYTLPRDFDPRISTKYPIGRTPKVHVSTTKESEIIHAPSLDHARLAGILKSGYNLGKRSNSGENNLVAVNLNSRRVRKAMHLIESIRNGQDVATYLGYRLERLLHDSDQEMDKYIFALKRSFPYAQAVASGDSLSKNEREVSVVHGMKLIEKYREQTFTASNLPEWAYDALDESRNSLPESHAAVFVSGLIELDDILDSVSDLTVTEGVYHIVKGNHVQASTVVNAISLGKPLPEIEFTKTPMDGTPVHHKTIIHLPTYANTDLPSVETIGEWGGLRTPKALANPQLNAWLVTQLPAAQNVSIECTITTVNDAGEEVTQSLEKDLSQCAIEPIDLVYAVSDATQFNDFVQNLMASTFQDASVVFSIVDGPVTSTGKKSVFSLLFTLKKLHTLIEKGRAVEGSTYEEIVAQRAELAIVLDVVDLSTRIYNLCSVYAPTVAEGVQETIAELHTAYQSAPLSDKLTKAQAVCDFIFGAGITVFGQFQSPVAGAAIYPARVYDNTDTTDTGRLKIDTWLSSISKVRTQMRAFNQLSMVHYHTQQERINIDPVQFPESSDWLGVALSNPLSLDDSEKSFTSFNCINKTYTQEGLVSGIQADEWIEVLPTETHTTGIALHIDQPDAVAPQSLLLAVPPHNDAPTWSEQELLGVVHETIAMTRTRLLEPHHINKSIFGQLNPGITIEREADNSLNTRAGTLSIDAVSKLKYTQTRADLLARFEEQV
ncbi:MAG: hypothetical protein OCD01_05150 [Fibrobacterales bacterium]